ncbi:hypothetical protein JHK87_016494 [Glycine soja]|nr:hypothetical protein JHK87_016494 [Glycine soja]
MELPLFDLATLVNATNNFSTDNKLGQGGFGPIYKVEQERGHVASSLECYMKKLNTIPQTKLPLIN